jgi:hypothetical protein
VGLAHPVADPVAKGQVNGRGQLFGHRVVNVAVNC